jgi:hypothetical protein
MVPPSVSAVLAPTAEKSASFRTVSYTNIGLSNNNWSVEGTTIICKLDKCKTQH